MEQSSSPYPQQQVPQPGQPTYPVGYQTQPVQAGQNYVYVQTTTTPNYQSQTSRFENFPGKKYFPKFHMCLAVTFLIMNCIIPGLGTLLAAFLVFLPAPICKVEGGCGNRCACFAIHFFSALGQLITLVIVIGYIWAIFWGYAFIFVTAESIMLNRDDQIVTEHVIPPPAAASDQPPAYTSNEGTPLKN